MMPSNYPPGVTGFEDAITGGEDRPYYDVTVEYDADLDEWNASLFLIDETGESSDALGSATGRTIQPVLSDIAEAIKYHEERN